MEKNISPETVGTPTVSPQSLQLLRIKSVLQMFPVSRARWYMGIKNGEYPKPVKLGVRTVAWRMADILALIEKTTARG